MKWISSKLTRRSAALATARCPEWMGSNAPPNNAMRLGWCFAVLRCACAVVNTPPGSCPAPIFSRIFRILSRFLCRLQVRRPLPLLLPPQTLTHPHHPALPRRFLLSHSPAESCRSHPRFITPTLSLLHPSSPPSRQTLP